MADTKTQTVPKQDLVVKKRPNYLYLFIVAILVVTFAIGLKAVVEFVVILLTDFILNTLLINESYVASMIGLSFLLPASALLIILMIIDGDEKRIQKIIKKYFSKMVVTDYYTKEGVPLKGPDFLTEDQIHEDKLRAAASVRPKAAAIEDAYKEGLIDGTFKEFHPNGEIKREIRYLGGKKNGLMRTYYANGQLEQEAVYVDDNIEGDFRSYYEDGSSHQEKTYVKGKLNGVYKAYDEHGVPFFEITYKDDIQHGPDKIYDQMGVMQFMDTYHDGVLINRKTYNEYGVLMFDQDFKENIVQETRRLMGEDEVLRRLYEEREKRKEARKKKK